MRRTTVARIKASNGLLHFQVNGKDYMYWKNRPSTGGEFLRAYDSRLVGKELPQTKRTYVLYRIARALYARGIATATADTGNDTYEREVTV